MITKASFPNRATTRHARRRSGGESAARNPGQGDLFRDATCSPRAVRGVGCNLCFAGGDIANLIERWRTLCGALAAKGRLG